MTGWPSLDQLERALDAIERQVEARRGAGAAAGVERDHAPADVDDRRARRAARGAGRRLDVERVEVVVLADAVLGRLAIEPRERARQDRQLLAGVVADDADLGADLRAFRVERQRRRLDVAQLRRVVAIERRSRAPGRDRPARSSTSSRFWNTAVATTGPGVTTCRLVRISPRSASTTNPVAWLDWFHSVSKARVWSISIVTTAGAMRDSVWSQASVLRIGGERDAPGATRQSPAAGRAPARACQRTPHSRLAPECGAILLPELGQREAVILRAGMRDLDRAHQRRDRARSSPSRGPA